MPHKLRRLKRGKGIIYVEVDGEKRAVTKFLTDFLKIFDERLYTLATEKNDINKRNEGRAYFLLGADTTLVVIDNHVIIHSDREDKCMEIVEGMFEQAKE